MAISVFEEKKADIEKIKDEVSEQLGEPLTVTFEVYKGDTVGDHNNKLKQIKFSGSEEAVNEAIVRFIRL